MQHNQLLRWRIWLSNRIVGLFWKMTWTLRVDHLLLYCPKRGDLLQERAFPLTWLSTIFSGQLTGWMCTNMSHDHANVCATDKIPRLTCVLRIFFFPLQMSEMAFSFLISYQQQKGFKFNLHFFLCFSVHTSICISVKVEMLVAALSQQVCVSVCVPVYTFRSMLFELSGSQTFNHREKIECSLSSTARFGGSLYWKTPPTLSCLLIYLYPSLLMPLTSAIVSVFHNDSRAENRLDGGGGNCQYVVSLHLLLSY